MSEESPLLAAVQAHLNDIFALFEEADKDEQGSIGTKIDTLSSLIKSKRERLARVPNVPSPPGGDGVRKGVRRPLPKENPERLQAIKEDIVVSIGNSGGEASTAQILRYVKEACDNFPRDHLTQILNRMCQESKISKTTLLRSIEGKRGDFGLTAQGFEAYKRFTGASLSN